MASPGFLVLGILAGALVGGGALVGYNMTHATGSSCGGMMQGGWMMGGGGMMGNGQSWQQMQAQCQAMMNGGSATGNSTPVAGTSVVMQGIQFNPTALQVTVGQTVTWTNRDSVAHTVTSDASASPLDSPMIGPGESWSFTFTQAGNYLYHCTPHSSTDQSGAYRGMTGRIIVTQ